MEYFPLIGVVAGYLVGAVPFAAVSLWGTGIDITRVGSGNPGFNNVLRVASRPRALLALAGDLFKGTLVLFVLSRLGDTSSLSLLWAFGLASVAGHCTGPYLGFKGGKGVATSAGVFLYLHWWQALAGAPVYFLVRLYGKRRGWSQRGAIASLAMLAVIAALVVGFAPREAAPFAVALFALVLVRHASNLREILAATKGGAQDSQAGGA